jgi:hypothetical protein
MTFDQWAAQYRSMMAAAERSRASKRVLLDRACRDAGIGEYHGCVLHNALIGADRGQPWRGVNGSALRRARRIEGDLFAAHAIVDRWARRTRP